ncbi:MAG: hypothetical protein L0229_05250 [Blastocatellia bacterium]|nr:hypothetical protein [Blastocatellia bacterium]
MRVIDEEKRLVQYLLGELTADEREALEDLYIADQEFFDRLLATEDDLIDDYAQGRLSGKESLLFEENFLTSAERRDRVRAAKALARFVEATPVAREKVSLFDRMFSYLKGDSGVMRLAAYAAMLLLIAGSVGMWIELGRVRSQLDEVQSGQVAQLRREEELKESLGAQQQASEQLEDHLRNAQAEQGRLQDEIAKLREPQVQVYSEVLGLGVLERPRGGYPPEKIKTVEVSARYEIVRFQLDLMKDDYPGYVVVVEDESGQEVWRAAVSVSKRLAIVVRIPARLLRGGRYNLVLNGVTDAKAIETISEYPILVVKK